MLSIPSISLINTTNHQKNNIINFPSSLHISHQTTQISLQTPPATTTTKPLYPSTPLRLTMPPHPNPNPPPQTHPSATTILTTKTISITHSPLNPPHTHTQKPTHRPPRLHQQTAERMGPRPAQIRGMVHARLRTPVPGRPSSDESAVRRRQNRRAGKARE